MRDIDVIVIGGGAAGLMCALHAGQRGRTVLVLESSNKVGKKILMSGGGRCNFTNLRVEHDNYVSNNTHFSISALRRFTPQDFLAMVERHGIDHHEREHGQLFCDHSSKDILRMLLDECANANVEIQTHCSIQSIDYRESDLSTYQLQTSNGEYRCESLVVATGGLSIPKMGASGFGYDIARQFGMSVMPVRAGLVPFTFSDNFGALCKRLSGVSIEAELSTEISRPAAVRGQRSFLGKLLFTHRGLSGPAALQLSNYWQPSSPLGINLCPGQRLGDRLMAAKRDQPRARLRSILAEYCPRSLVLEVEKAIWGDDSEKPLAEWPERSLVAIGDRLQAWQVTPAGTEGYRTAEVTIGGVNCDEISSKTMESKRQAGLYFIGEVVDVTGQLGGFNFQWAWASGYVAGCYV